jgi:tRNA (guanine37-N1)-methyltransferase
MHFHVLTLFPEMVMQACSHSIVKRGMAAGLIAVNCVDIRDFAVNKHGQVDDAPYGGGAGMVMMAPPVYDAYQSVEKPDARFVFLTPQGRPFKQSVAVELSQEKDIILLCGHYEGVDQRVIDALQPDEISIGDYILTGGELAALVVIDAVARLVPGVLGKVASHQDESFTDGLLEYPQYTRPPVFNGAPVPEILLSGHHGQVEAWRREQAVLRTQQRRPDLLKT